MNMTSDEFDAPSMLSRKRKSAVSQDPSSPVDDSVPSSSAAVADAVALHVEVNAGVPESSMRARHRAAAAARALVLPLASTVAAVSVAASGPSETCPQREAKRPRVDQRRHKQHHHHLLQAPQPLAPAPPTLPSCAHQRTRQAWRKRRANSLPNIHLRSPQYSHRNPSDQHGCYPMSSRLGPATYPRATTPAGTSCRQTARSGTSSPVSHSETHGLHCRYSLPAPQIPLDPLINRETLRELDLEAILRNPQLRHDLLFDPGLQFQPTMSRRKRDVTSKYWFAVQRELECGCTCTAFDSQGKLLECICLSPASTFPSVTLRIPSRIQRLISELLEVLLSVISPSTTPSQPHSPTNMIPTTIFHHPHYSSQEVQLRAALDPRLIQQELEHGIFDPSGLFQLLGTILKCHCAPMRDRAVDTMVAIAQNCAPGKGGSMEDAVKAIRLCFEILELMKLDIANHQLLALRPYLVTTSSDFELRTFQERFGHGLVSLNLTRAWLQKSFDTNPSIMPSSTSTCPIASSNLRAAFLSRIHRSMLRALTDSVFSPCNDAEANYPETFYLDHLRLAALSHEASDILTLYMLIMLYRQLSCAKRRPPTDAELELVKRQIKQIGPARLGRCFTVSNSDTSVNRSKSPSPPISSSKAKTGSRSSADGSTAEEWNTRIADVLLQLAACATDPTTSATAPREQLPPPGKQTLALLDGWTTSNLKPNSSLSELLKMRLKSALFEIVGNIVVARDPTGGLRGSGIRSPNGAGLEVLTSELRSLGEKIANLGICHWRVYGALYETEGFVVSTG